METPRILYQTWKTNDLPGKFKKNWEEWEKFCPSNRGWKHVLLSDEDLRNLVKDVAPQHLKDYDGFTQNIERVDFARLAMMYKGGVYADLDTYPIKPIDIFIDGSEDFKGKIILGREPVEHANDIYDGRKVVLCNAFMISPPNKKIWLDMMDYIIDNYEHNYRPVDNTGPMAMTRFYEKYPQSLSDAVITEPCVFFPLMGNGKVTKGCDMDKSTYVVHEWTNTWVSKPWNDPLWFNRRYWRYALLFVFIVLWIYLAVKQKII
jgi:hypothetical protein